MEDLFPSGPKDAAAKNKETGQLGENLAADYLVSQGFEIIKRNWRFARYEIDIIAKEKNKLVVVEVKTRSEGYLLEPEFAVTMKKQASLIRAANAYIRYNKVNLDTRFDIVSVVISGEEHKISHIRGAFYPTLYHRG